MWKLPLNNEREDRKMNLKQKLQNLFKIQTKDNNFSKKNLLENENLTSELAMRSICVMQENESKSIQILKNHIKNWTYRNEGVDLPEMQALLFAHNAFARYKECGFIDRWNNIRKDLIEYLM